MPESHLRQKRAAMGFGCVGGCCTWKTGAGVARMRGEHAFTGAAPPGAAERSPRRKSWVREARFDLREAVRPSRGGPRRQPRRTRKSPKKCHPSGASAESRNLLFHDANWKVGLSCPTLNTMLFILRSAASLVLTTISSSQTSALPRDFSITLERIGCLGACPGYKVTIPAGGYPYCTKAGTT
jgi:hypothetical protein